MKSSLLATLAVLVLAATILKLVLEASVLRHLRPGGDDRVRGTAVLLTRELRSASSRRLACGVIGGVAGPAVLLVQLDGPAASGTPVAASLAVVAMLALVAGELVERSQFFTAVTRPRMPGVPS